MAGPNDKPNFDKDPFQDDRNRVKSWPNKDGQTNQKIIEGPDTGVHRFYDPEHNRSGQTGTERPNRDGG